MAGKGTLTVRILGDASHLDSTLGGMSRTMSDAGSKMANIGKKMTVGMTLPIVGIGAAAVNTAMDFEQSMNVLQASSGASTSEMKKLGDLAVELGNDLSLPGTSAADAGEAMTELAKAGLSVNDVMTASKGVLQLSAAGQLSNADAAEVTANALNAFNLKGTEASRVADLLAAAANSSSAGVGDMADGLKMSAAVFSSAGFEIDELSTAMALMANAGVKGSDAGTSLKQAILSLQAPTIKAKDIMRDMGFAAYDAEGNMKPLREIIAGLATATGGMTQAQRDYTLATIFGSDAVRAINILLAEGTGGYDAMNTSVTKAGSAANLAAAQNKGLKGAIDALKSTAETFLLTAAVPMLDNLKGLITKLAGAVEWFGKLDPGIQTATFAGLAFLAVLGPVVGIIGTLTTAIAGLTAAITFIAAHPIVLAIAAVAALAAGLIYAYKTSETFRNVVNAVFGGVASAASSAFSWIRTHIDLVINGLNPLGIAMSLLRTHWGEVMVFLTSSMSGAWSIIQGLVDKVVTAVDRVVGAARRIRDAVGANGTILNESQRQQIEASRRPTKRAAGGHVWPGEDFLVGENGPEVVQFGAHGNVTPNHQLGRPGATVVLQLKTYRAGDLISGRELMDKLYEVQRTSGPLKLKIAQ